MVRILVVADEIVPSLYSPSVQTIKPDLIVAAGDLPWDYLDFLESSLNVPLVFVPGNHDPEVEKKNRSGLCMRDGMPCSSVQPYGGINVDGTVAEVAGLRIAGLGGCVRYRPGPNQYSQRQYAWKARRLVRKARRAFGRDSGIDILLTHAPPFGLGDEQDRPHVGVHALHRVLAELQPRWHLHGHIHPYGVARPDRQVGRTTIRNVVPWKIMEIEPASTISTEHRTVLSG